MKSKSIERELKARTKSLLECIERLVDLLDELNACLLTLPVRTAKDPRKLIMRRREFGGRTGADVLGNHSASFAALSVVVGRASSLLPGHGFSRQKAERASANAMSRARHRSWGLGQS
jgi:hypothetical protein